MKLSQSNSTSRAEIIIQYKNGQLSKAIEEALSPDNLQAPKGLDLSVIRDGSKIVIEVHNEKGVGTLLSTLDDILDCASAAEKAIHGIR
jgi:hypothetical protein